MRTLQRGFTLIELMIVVAIIAILAAIAVPAYQDYVVRTQVTEGIVLADGAKSAVWDYISTHGTYPSENGSVGLPSPSSISGKYVSAVSVASGLITVAFDNPEANRAIHTDTLQLSPNMEGGSIKWTCKSGIPPQYLPTSCRPGA